MAIPTVPEILAGVAAKTYTLDQAAVWIDLHIGEAVVASRTRDDFAQTAMCLLLNAGVTLTEVPRQSYEMADKILAARNR